MLTLYPHQQKIVYNNPSRHLLAHSTGTGKTITSISLANKNCKTCLVIVPKILKELWERETDKYASGCKYTVITKETFKRDAEMLPKVDGIIVDEGHYFANRKSALSQALRWYCKRHDIKFRWFCTATPYLSTPWNIYSIAEHLGHKWDYWKFFHEYFYNIKMGGRTVPKIRANIDDKLAVLVAKIGSIVDMKEVVEVPEQKFITEYFDLTEEQNEGMLEIEDTTFIARWTKKHQVENGVLYGDVYTQDQHFKCLKNDYIASICEKNKKTAIFCRYNGQIDYLAKLLSPLKKVYILNGQAKDRDKIIQSINEDDECIAIIQSQCSVGYELPTIDTIIFASLSFSYVDYAQGIGRFLRINRLKENTYYHLVTNGVDQDVYDCIMRKEDFYVALQENKRVDIKIDQIYNE